MARTYSVKKVDGRKSDNLKKYLRALSKNHVEMGWFDEQGVHPSPRNTDSWTYATLAAYHELFTERHPNRPILGTTVDNNQQDLIKSAHKHLKKALRKAASTSVVSPKHLLDVIGKEWQQAIKATIQNPTMPDPMNKPSTVRKKGFNNPMYETGALYDAVAYRNSITNKVIEK